MLINLDKGKWQELINSATDFLLFKHSNSCPVSAAAKEVVDKVSQRKDVYMVVVQEDRELSNIIADKLHLKHETPQLIRISKGQVLQHASHYDINEENYL